MSPSLNLEFLYHKRRYYPKLLLSHLTSGKCVLMHKHQTQRPSRQRRTAYTARQRLAGCQARTLSLEGNLKFVCDVAHDAVHRKAMYSVN